MVGLPHSPGLPEPGAALAAVNDRRAASGACGLIPGCARRLGDVRPGRRNGSCQPNSGTLPSRKRKIGSKRRTSYLLPDSEEAI